MQIHDTAFIAPGAVVLGDVTIGENSGIWYNAVVRGDRDSIVIGKESNIQDNAVVHLGSGYPVEIGDHVTIGHGAIVHGCKIGDNTMIGMGAILMNGCKIGKNCIIGAGTLVTQNVEIPDNSLVIGNPGKVKRAVTEEEIRWNLENARIYVEEAQEEKRALTNRLVCFNIKELGKQLKQLGMLVIQDQVWNRVTVNRAAGKTTRYYVDEFHLLLKGELASWSVEIWKRFRKWGGIPTGITQNIKDLLASREIENIFENSDFIYMLNQAAGDRQILAKQLNISPHQLSYVTHSSEGEGLLFYGNVILPFIDRFPKDTELYRIMTTKPQEVSG